MPLAKSSSSKSKSKSPATTRKPPTVLSDSDSDVPLATVKLSKEKAAILNEASKVAKKLTADDKKPATKRKPAVKKEEDSDSDTPLKKRTPAKKEEELSDDDMPLAKKRTPAKKEEQLSDDDMPLAKRPRTTKAAVKKEPVKKAPAKKTAAAIKKEAAALTKGKGRAKKSETPATPAEGEEDEDEEEYKWWENQGKTDGSIKWTTLEHNGVLFPPEYEPLPAHVKMKYNGVPVTLPIQAEEVAGFFGAMLDSPHAQNPKFVENFFKDFQEILKESGGAKDDKGKV